MSKFKVGDDDIIGGTLNDLYSVGIINNAERLLGSTVTIMDTKGNYWGVVEKSNGFDWSVKASTLEAVKVPKPSIPKPKVNKPKVPKPSIPKPKKAKLSLADMLTLYPQTRKVLSHLEKHGSISPLEAFGVYKITRLAARINEIRNAGVQVATMMKQDAAGTRYASYSLI